MNDQLSGKRCLVTGGTRGIGKAISLEMARRGAVAVTALGTNEERGRKVAAEIEAEGARGAFVSCDLSDHARVKEAIDEAVERMGGIDVLVNNAAATDAQFTQELRLDQLPVEVWDRVYTVNVRGTWLAMKYAVPHLACSSSPAIVNLSSVSGSQAFYGEACYGATKAAILQLTRAAAYQLQPLGIRTTCCSPGAIETDMIQEQIEAADDPAAKRRDLSGWHLTREPRLGEPAEIARVVCFLASDEASFVNGAEIKADAGLSVWRGCFA